MAVGGEILTSYSIHTHIHIICNYNSQCMMLRERRGVTKWGDVIRHIVTAPASCGPARCTSRSDTSPSHWGRPCPLCISYNGIVCSNNFNGSRQRISFARRLGKEISREYMERKEEPSFFRYRIRRFSFISFFQRISRFIVYFTYNFAASFFFRFSFVVALVLKYYFLWSD